MIFFFFLRGIVTLTDLPENVQQLKKNIDDNKNLLKTNPQAVALKWGNPFESEPFDFLLMADCIYYPEVSIPNYCLYNIVCCLLSLINE